MENFLAIGVFDGVHVGHRKILSEMVAQAGEAGAGSAVLTFEPHPDAVILPTGAPPLLTDLDEKARLIRGLGVGQIHVLPFTRDLARLPAEDFAEEVLCPRFRPARVFVGYNFTFGHRGAGTPELLAQEGGRLGFTVQVFPPITLDGEVVSSTLIRRYMMSGAVEQAARALGRPYQLAGTVVRGAGRGRDLGFPTANLAVPAALCRPAPGVYVVLAGVEEEGPLLPGVANLGSRPTFARDGADVETMEVHLLDFDGNLYGRGMRVHFLARLRGEMAFPSPEVLRRQITGDIAAARQMLHDKAVYPPAGRIKNG